MSEIIEIAAKIISAYATLEKESLTEILYNQIGYGTHLVDGRGAVFRSGEVLSVQECFDQGWTLPGGWAHVGVSLSKAEERVVCKESGFRVGAACLVGLYGAMRNDSL